MQENYFFMQCCIFCWSVSLLSICIWTYERFYGWISDKGWTLRILDRWLLQQRRAWLLSHDVALPVVSIIFLVLGIVIGRWQRTSAATSVFNTEAEQFPQEERLLKNPYSVNLKTKFEFRGKVWKGWINLIEPFRGLLVMGSPGSGKSYFIVRPLIAQYMEKGFCMFVYDFKYDDLTLFAWECFLRSSSFLPAKPTFHMVHFDDLQRSARCNPLHPSTLSDLADAAEASRILLLGLNRDWIRKQGDFFVESAINFLTAIVWFLRRYEQGRYCTLPHVIELMQAPYDQLFSVLRTEPEIEFLVNPFVSAYMQNVMPQLEGQIAGAKISLARLTSPHLYYILSGNDFTLDINNPASPRIVCMGNSPQKQEVYGAVLSLYVSRMVRLVNKPGGLPCSLIFDEFPTLYFHGMDTLLATARSNRIATTIVVQDMSQLRKEYGREQADVLLNITGNIISGQVSGESARQLSERIGRILQHRGSTHQGVRHETSSVSVHLDPALPPSRISTLSSGEMIGILSDAPGQQLRYKLFHGKVKSPPAFPGLDSPLPIVADPPTIDTIQKQYMTIKSEVQQVLHQVMKRILHEPSLRHLAVRR